MPRIDLIKIRRGLAADWTSVNPILASGEIGLETDTNTFKFGNGTDVWSQLPYFTSGATPEETNPIENVYADIASLLADQVNQTEKFFQVVLDDGLGAEAYFEKLASSTGTLSTDYRELSSNEVLIIRGNASYRTFRIDDIQDEGTPLTSVRGGRISFEYNGTDVTAILFNAVYTDALVELYGTDVNFIFYNQSTRKYEKGAIASGAWTTVNTDYYRGALTGSEIQIADLTANDRLDFFISQASAGGGGATLTSDVTQVAHNLVAGDAIRHNGTIYVKALADDITTADVIGVVSEVTDADNFTFQYGGILTTGTWTLGESYFLSNAVAGSIVTEPTLAIGEVRQFIGTGVVGGLLLNIDIGDEILAQASSSIPASDTGTTITFTEDTLWNEITFLTSGNITLDLTGAVKGVVSLVYCNGYVPTISGETYFLASGNIDGDSLNLLSFFYDGTKIYLAVANVATLGTPALTLTEGDTEIQVDWDAIANADNYVIERALDSGFTTGLTEIYSGALLTFTDTGLTNGTTYYYRGKAEGAGFIESAYSATASDAPVAPTDFTTNLVASYSYDTDFSDYTTNNDATATGDVTIVAGGKVSNCADFAGTTDYLTVADSDDLSFGNGTTDSPFSISFWVEFDAINGAGQWIINKRQSATLREYDIRIDGGTGTEGVNVILFDDSSGGRIEAKYTQNLGTGGFYHVCITYDGSGLDTGIEIYFDGVIQTLTRATTGTYTAMENLTNPVIFGAQAWSTATGELDGRLDEFHIWKNRELTASEVTEIYNLENAGTSILP